MTLTGLALSLFAVLLSSYAAYRAGYRQACREIRPYAEALEHALPPIDPFPGESRAGHDRIREYLQTLPACREVLVGPLHVRVEVPAAFVDQTRKVMEYHRCAGECIDVGVLPIAICAKGRAAELGMNPDDFPSCGEVPCAYCRGRAS